MKCMLKTQKNNFKCYKKANLITRRDIRLQILQEYATFSKVHSISSKNIKQSIFVYFITQKDLSEIRPVYTYKQCFLFNIFKIYELYAKNPNKITSNANLIIWPDIRF